MTKVAVTAIMDFDPSIPQEIIKERMEALKAALILVGDQFDVPTKVEYDIMDPTFMNDRDNDIQE